MEKKTVEFGIKVDIDFVLTTLILLALKQDGIINLPWYILVLPAVGMLVWSIVYQTIIQVKGIWDELK